MGWEKELALATKAADGAGAYLRSVFGKKQKVLHLDARDVKLEADIHAEEIILAVLDETGLPVLAEESGEHGAVGSDDPYWVVDPLDGTGNFSRGVSSCCVSIALCANGNPVLGVVKDFTLDELFAGIVGKGASLNGAPISVSALTEPKKGILATGFPKNFQYSEVDLRSMFEDMRQFMKVRMIGSSALALAYVACGRFDAYSENRVMFWDFAGGMAIVQAAGGYADFVADEDLKWASNVRCAASKDLWTALRK